MTRACQSILTAFFSALILLMTACGGKQTDKPAETVEVYSMIKNAPGDSTVYGLACDGCNDTILVFLPRIGGDPDTFNILTASKQQHVYGHPMIGNKMAVVVNRDNPRVADIVIDLELLKGEWCYMVKPQLRKRADGNEDFRHLERGDTLLRNLMEPREYGFEIKSDHQARSIGMTYEMTSDEESPVVLPPLKSYHEWQIFNGRLVLKETRRDSTGNTMTVSSDTAQFVLMRRDTLVLRFTNGEQRGYYKKQKKVPAEKS